MIAIYMHQSPLFADTTTLETDLLAFAKSHKGQVIWYKDESEDMIEHPEFERMMEDARAGKLDKIVVWRLDQVGGTGPRLVKLLDELRDLGVRFASLKEAIDL